MAIKPIDFSGVNPVGTPTAVDVQNAGEQAISFRQQLPDLESKLREALSTKFNESPLFRQRESAAQEFLAAPSAIRADISNIQRGGTILSPTQQEAITGARRAAAFAPLSTSNLMLGTAFGGLENMLAGGVKAFEAAATAQEKRADLLSQLRQQEIERQFKEQQLAMDWMKLSASQAKPAQKQVEAMQSIQEALSAINNARVRLKAGGAGMSGWFAGLRKFLPAGFGGISQQTSELDSALSTVNKSLFETSGKAFTKTEAEILGGRVPKTGYQPEIIENTLNELERDLLTRATLMQGGNFTVGGESSLDNFWE